jgi:hypothetical protein
MQPLKLVFTFCSVFCLMFGAFAQTSEVYGASQQSKPQSKGYIGLSIGGAIPLGAYAATQDPVKSGYAISGGSINLIHFQYQVHELLAVNASWFGVSNSVNLEALTADIFSASGTAGVTTTLDKPSAMGGLLVGVSFKKTTFPLYAKASAGYAGVQNAEITFKQTGSVSIKQSDMSIGFAYEFGAGGLFQLGNHFGVMMEATYLGTTAKSKGVEIMAGNTVIGKGDFDYSPSVFVLRAGLGYMF